jgi:hypothetical protein
LLNQLPPSLQEQNDLQRAIHHNHWDERISIIQALSAGYHKSEQSQARKMSACGETARLYLDPKTDSVRTLIHRCKNRICPWCTNHRTAKAAKQILRIMSTMASPRSIVLTARSTSDPLPQQISAMRTAFKRLRTDKRWRALVHGGVYCVEVTWNARASTWHPHLHLIVDGNYFPQPLLSALWSKASGGSDIVWIKRADNRLSAAMELAAYIGKPPKVKEMNPAALRAYASATRGIRMLQTFGNCRSQKAEDSDEPFVPPPDSGTISVNRIRFLATKGQPQAQALSSFLPVRFPIFRRFFKAEQEAERSPPCPLDADRIAELNQTIARNFSELLGQQDAGNFDIYDILDRQ